MFATDILNNENTLTLSVCTKSSYDDQRKHDGFGHDVTSIGLGYPPIYKLPPPPSPIITCPLFILKIFIPSLLSSYLVFWIPLPLFIKWGRGSQIMMTQFRGGANFDYLPQRGGSAKSKKGGGSMVQGQVFLKGGGGFFPI